MLCRKSRVTLPFGKATDTAGIDAGHVSPAAPAGP